jgi:acetyl esterase/lipase
MPKQLKAVFLLALAANLLSCRGPAAQEGSTRVRDVIYGRKHGVVLTMDVFKPAKPTGVGTIFVVSGGWFSSHESINPGYVKAAVDRGQTVFAVVHGSQPKYAIPEIMQDIDRAVRFIRYHAAEYGVDPDRLGIMGGSAGGHLSLMQGALGKPGDPNAKDPVDRVSSRVQAIAAFFPPTDFLNYGEPNKNAITTLGKLSPFRPAFGLKSDEPAELESVAKNLSPMTHLTKEMPPTLLIHGDADTLVPIQQAQVLVKRLEELGVPQKLVVRPGLGHGWPTIGQDVAILAEWIDQHVARKK